MPDNGPVVVGLDPGVSETGWAVLTADASPRLVASGLIRTAPSTPMPARLQDIHREFSAVLAAHRPEAVAVEEMFFMKRADTVRMTLQARGVLLLAAAQAGPAITEHNPRTVKLTLTGSGSAQKAQMQQALKRALGLADILRPNDVADAAAVALCHLRSQRYKRLQVLDRIGGRK